MKTRGVTIPQDGEEEELWEGGGDRRPRDPQLKEIIPLSPEGPGCNNQKKFEERKMIANRG